MTPAPTPPSESSPADKAEWIQQARGQTKIHRTAIVSETARLGLLVTIGPYAEIGPDANLAMGVDVHHHAWLGANVRLLQNANLHPYSVVEDNATIGQLTHVPEGVRVGHDTTLGREVKIQSNPDKPITIGRYSIIGDKEVITENIPVGTLKNPQKIFTSWGRAEQKAFIGARKEAIALAISRGEPCASDPNILDGLIPEETLRTAPAAERTEVVTANVNEVSTSTNGTSRETGKRNRFGGLLSLFTRNTAEKA